MLKAPSQVIPIIVHSATLQPALALLGLNEKITVYLVAVGRDLSTKAFGADVALTYADFVQALHVVSSHHAQIRAIGLGRQEIEVTGMQSHRHNRARQGFLGFHALRSGVQGNLGSCLPVATPPSMSGAGEKATHQKLPQDGPVDGELPSLAGFEAWEPLGAYAAEVMARARRLLG